MTRRRVTVSIYQWKAWKITARYLRLCRDRLSRWELDIVDHTEMAKRISSVFNTAERDIYATNKFCKITFEESIKKIVGEKIEYNTAYELIRNPLLNRKKRKP